MDALAWEAEPPQLRSPILVCAFAGWNDAAGSATTALTTAAESLDAEVIAQIDPEEFFDFQANRPTIHLTEGQTREIEWPGNVLLTATPEGAERDLLLLAGTEPNLKWRTFSDGIAEIADSLGVEMVVTLGALIADVAHTLPVPITGLASDEEMVERLGLARSNYEGPTGVVGVLHDACRRRGISSASLWAAVPHYVAAVPNPKAALALLRRLEGLIGVAVEASGLEEESESYESQVSRAVAANPEIEELVKRLEQEQSEHLDLEEDVPSGESLARDFERYLRQQGNG
ncbi:MAG TPA: PAC2 family protein [Solirubrobacterales bacterium]|nr:PAC2 family protein [Solirubrobacterales bacterium]